MLNIGDESITPELVLVDPELAARVRATAVACPPAFVHRTASPSALEVAIPSDAAAAESPAPVAELQLPVVEPPVLAAGPLSTVAEPTAPAATPLITVAVPWPLTARGLTPDAEPGRRNSPRLRWPRPASIVIGVAVLALLLAGFLPPRQAPRLGEVTAPAIASPAPLTLGWQPHEALVYLVEMFAGKTLVHAASTRKTTFDVPGWLAPGRYTWRISAYAGPRSGAFRPERPFEQGWFVIDPARR